MKVKALQNLRQKLKKNEPIYGLWVTLESASITEMAVALGLDWVVIDAEHGHLDWKDINSHISAALRSDTVVLVRIAERSTILSKRALDIGADGIEKRKEKKRGRKKLKKLFEIVVIHQKGVVELVGKDPLPGGSV